MGQPPLPVSLWTNRRPSPLMEAASIRGILASQSVQKRILREEGDREREGERERERESNGGRKGVNQMKNRCQRRRANMRMEQREKHSLQRVVLLKE